MPVRDICNTNVITADQDASAQDLADKMTDANVGCVVITDGNKPVGLITDRDLVTRALSKGASGHAIKARDIMSSDPATVEADAGIFELTDVMRSKKVRRVPVMENGELKGIAALDDVMQHLAKELNDLAAVIEAESPELVAAR